jgi:hypothetical protein
MAKAKPKLSRKSSVPASSTDLGSRFEGARKSGGGIVPGANVYTPPPIGNPFTQIGNLIKKATKKRKKP